MDPITESEFTLALVHDHADRQGALAGDAFQFT